MDLNTEARETLNGLLSVSLDSELRSIAYCMQVVKSVVKKSIHISTYNKLQIIKFDSKYNVIYIIEKFFTTISCALCM